MQWRLNKFILLLKKGVYPYEHMDNWKKFDETTIPPKGAFYSNLNEEGISDADCANLHRSKSMGSIQNKKLYQIS